MPRRQDASPHGSWSEAISSYVQEKSYTTPEFVPVKRFLRGDGAGWKRDAREYNIVSCQIPSADARESRAQAERAQAETLVNKAIEKTLKKAHHCYDIVTMEPKYGVDETTVAAVGGNQEPRGKRIQPPPHFLNYDIVTNEKVPALAHIPDDTKPPKLPSKNRPVRATNILNHEFVHDHEAKQRAEDDAIRSRIERAVDNGRSFNPITQQFNDAGEEYAERNRKATFEDSRRELVRTHTYKTSGIVKRSEGHAFDIVTNHVYNPDMVLALDRRDATSIPQRAALRQQWEFQRDAEEALRDADVTRALKRVAKERLQDSVSHGYDILSNQPFVQVDRADTKTKPHLLTLAETLRQPTTMEKLDARMVPRGTTTSTAIRADGPRTTSERLFNTRDSRTTGAAASFDSRRQLLLPTLQKVKDRAPDTGSAFTATR